MEINDDYNNVPKEIRMQFIKDCITELYPFSDVDIEFYEDKLDFKILSYNSRLNWSYQLLDKYKEKWNWNLIENNNVISEQMNLPLLFPKRVKYKLPKCDCHRKLDFCDRIQPYCYQVVDNPITIEARKPILNVSAYRLLEFAIEEQVFDENMLFDVLFRNADFTFNEMGKDEESEPEDDFNDVPF